MEPKGSQDPATRSYSNPDDPIHSLRTDVTETHLIIIASMPRSRTWSLYVQVSQPKSHAHLISFNRFAQWRNKANASKSPPARISDSYWNVSGRQITARRFILTVEGRPAPTRTEPCQRSSYVCSVATEKRSLLFSTKVKQTNICEEHGHNLLATSHLRLWGRLYTQFNPSYMDIWAVEYRLLLPLCKDKKKNHTSQIKDDNAWRCEESLKTRSTILTLWPLYTPGKVRGF